GGLLMKSARMAKKAPLFPPRYRVVFRRFMPLLSLAGAVGLYCGYEPPGKLQTPAEMPTPTPTGSRTQGIVNTTLSDCNASSLTAAIVTATAGGGGTITLQGGCTYTFDGSAAGGSAPNNFFYGPNAMPVITSQIPIDGTAT